MSGSATLLLVGGPAVAAAVLAGPVPWWLERSTRLARRPRVLLASWCLWLATASLVLLGCCAAAGAIVGSWLSGDLSENLGANFGGNFGVNTVSLGALVGAGVAVLWMVAGGVARGVRVGRDRRGHRAAVELVGSFDERLPAWILEDARPLAYTIPDPRQSIVVLTRGVLTLADAGELQAVLSHERQHGRRLPSAVLTVRAVWGAVWPSRRLSRRVLPAVEVAAEMIADDAARDLVGSTTTIAAICRLQTGLPAACDEFGWEPDRATLRRVRRLLASGAA